MSFEIKVTSNLGDVSVATENADILKKINKKKSKIINEDSKNNIDTGSMLDENNIL